MNTNWLRAGWIAFALTVFAMLACRATGAAVFLWLRVAATCAVVAISICAPNRKKPT